MQVGAPLWIWGIAYTGFSQLENAPTHEWIATRLAKENCRSPYIGARILAEEGARALKVAPFPLELTFLIAGWARLEGAAFLVPHFLLITNRYDDGGKQRDLPGEDLRIFERRLRRDELYAARVIGQPLADGRGKCLDRSFRRMLKHKTSPKAAMQAFVNEIAYTADRRIGVGKKVLAFSIPRIAAHRAYEYGENLVLAMEPNRLRTAFCYFDPVYSQLWQYGPTFVCGDSAVTDVETENSPDRAFQSSSFRILHMPKHGNLPALVLRATER